jgi:sugar lactone lactonase YvrE
MRKKPTSLHLIDGNQLFCSLEDGLGIYDFRENNFNYLTKINDKDVRFNDGKCDRNGILYIGTICKKKPREKIANIYRFYNNMLENYIDNISNANGISFNKNNEMFFSDTTEKTIYKIENSNKKIINEYNYEESIGIKTPIINF